MEEEKAAAAPNNEKTISAPKEERRDSCWPDAVVEHDIVLDDVSQLSATPVNKLVMVRSEEDCFQSLEYAAKNGLQVTCRGTKVRRL